MKHFRLAAVCPCTCFLHCTEERKVGLKATSWDVPAQLDVLQENMARFWVPALAAATQDWPQAACSQSLRYLSAALGVMAGIGS